VPARGLALASLLVAFAFPTAGLAAECEGDDCQVPPPPPAEVIPATSVVVGPGNPPVRFEDEKPKAGGKPGHKHPKHPAHKGGGNHAHAKRSPAHGRAGNRGGR
jgi:hypothetical protein